MEQDEIHKPNFGDDLEVREIIIHSFWNRWRHKYLTSLQEFQKISGINQQKIKVGDIVLIHNDGPRVNWRLAVIENLVSGRDGFIQ